MATNFPSSLDSLTNPTSSDGLNSPDHAGQHANANDAIEALEAKVGVDGSAVSTSLDYKLTNGIMSQLNVDSGTLIVDPANNRVGVNTNSPATALDVVGTVTARTAAIQDGVALAGRAGGTSTYEVTLTPTTLTSDRTVTLPNVSGTAITTGNTSDITSVGALSSLAVSGTSNLGTVDAVGTVTVQNSSTQDAVRLQGRAGGSSSYRAILTPTTLTATRTLTLPDKTGTVATTADPGLIFIGATTIGSAVSTVSVSNCFSSTYDNYIITISGGTCSSDGQALTLSLGGTSGYYYSMVYTSWNNTVLGAGAANVGNWVYVGSCNTNGLAAYMELNSPYLSKNTRIRASIQNSTNYGGTLNGFLNTTTSYTGFTIGTSSGTLTGGTICVYGLRLS